MESFDSIFWLHIKKSAGQSARELLTGLYTQDNRSSKPQCFIMAEKKYWNDILNNYRTPLGSYQFKRTLFAKKFLYSESEFQRLFKFAFCREPVARCKSQFFYLWHKKTKSHSLRRQLLKYASLNFEKTVNWNFSGFLDAIEIARASDSNIVFIFKRIRHPCMMI